MHDTREHELKRRSFDLNFYDAGLLIEDLRPQLARMRQQFAIRPDQFRAIAEHTMHDRGVRSNPRPIAGPDDIVEILELARG